MDQTRNQSGERKEKESKTTSLTVEFTIKPPYHQDLFEATSETHATTEQILPSDLETVSIAFWTSSSGSESYEALVQQSNLVKSVAVLDEQTNGRTLRQIRLSAEATTYWSWAGLGGIFLGGVMTQEGWTIRMQYPNREALAAYRQHCKERGIPFSLESLSTGASAEERQLTASQSQLLEAAIECGYFDVPRGSTLAEIASQFDISNQAASERLRRALSNILMNYSSLAQ